MVSQRAENSALQKFCKEFEVINLLSRSNNHILVINKLESHISEFRNDIDVVEIGKWINRFLNSPVMG